MKKESALTGSPLTVSTREKYTPYAPLSFQETERSANLFADIIESRLELLTNILLEYESFEVVSDEVARTLDILRNLHENKKYFNLRVNEITTFLPRNQPLYAFTCFVVVPSLMAHKVYFRIPHAMRLFFTRLLETLDVHQLFPNIVVSEKTRLDFLRERSSVRVNPQTEETLPATDVVIFTGTPSHADQMRLIFDNRTLFITNGAGHNPVVVSSDADIVKAIEAVVTLQFYNQGQDCAAPNSILVHEDVYPTFLAKLENELTKVKVGEYRDRANRVGPISDPKDLVRIQDFLIHNQKWLDQNAPGIIRSRDAIVEPTIVCKPLREGGNFNEIFAPVIFLQRYSQDAELAFYFENPHYARNAMYITVYGTSDYISNLIGREFQHKVLHDKASVLFNTHLHEKGIERGTKPYGGYGYGASSLSIGGKIVPKPTLPQRDIYEKIVKPLLRSKSLATYSHDLKRFTEIRQKNVEKMLHAASQNSEESKVARATSTYIDTRILSETMGRLYAKIDEKNTYALLDQPNVEYMSTLAPSDIEMINHLVDLLNHRSDMSLDTFSSALYAVARKPGLADENRSRQLRFFQHIYQLLLGKKSGPRLAQFLYEIDLREVSELLNV